MNYIIGKFNVNDNSSCRPSDKQLNEWTSLLLDPHYLDYLLSICYINCEWKILSTTIFYTIG